MGRPCVPGLTLANTAIITVILFDARDEAGSRVRGQVWVVAESAPGRGLPALPWQALAGLQQVLVTVRGTAHIPLLSWSSTKWLYSYISCNLSHSLSIAKDMLVCMFMYKCLYLVIHICYYRCWHKQSCLCSPQTNSSRWWRAVPHCKQAGVCVCVCKNLAPGSQWTKLIAHRSECLGISHVNISHQLLVSRC